MDTKSYTSLKDTSKKLPFSVPENYFEDFAACMTAQTSERRVPFRRMAKSWLYMAGMFAGIILLGNVAYVLYQRNANLKIENYERYLLSQVDEMYLMDFYIEDSGDNQ